MAEQVASLIGLKGPVGPSAAAQQIQTAQRTSAERENIKATQAAAKSISTGSIKNALSFNDDRNNKKTTTGG